MPANIIKINIRYIFRFRGNSLLRVVSLASGVTSILLYWLYTVEYNPAVSGIGYLFSRCAVNDLLILAMMFAVVCTGYIYIIFRQSGLRRNEIFIRKIYGEPVRGLVLNLATETTILLIFSMMLSLIIIDQAVPILNGLTGKEVWFRTSMGSGIMATGFGLFLLLEFFCGIVPAYLVSRARIPDILKHFNPSQDNYQ